MQLGGSRFVAGETLDQAVVTLRRLNEQGLRTNTTLLGEFVKDAARGAEQVVETYEEVHPPDRRRGAADVRRAQADASRRRCSTRSSATRTSSGWSRSRPHGTGTSSAWTWRTTPLVDVTLRIYRRLREAGHDNVGTVLQAYLYRTEQDLESLLPLQPNLRIVKGAYKEPPSVAYPKKADVDAAYARLMERDAARRAGSPRSRRTTRS